MKKLFLILIIILSMTMVLSSEDLSDKQKERLNSLILTYQFQKITYDGQEGFFLPLTGYKRLILTLNDYLYYQDLNDIKDQRIKQLQEYEAMNFKLKTGLGISVSFNIGLTCFSAGLAMLMYSLNK